MTRFNAGGAVWLPAALTLLPCFGLWMSVIAATGGHFAYSLDDPYIHLALAKNIAQGHYGINPGEASAPSSSIVWPYVLALFAGLGRAYEWVPLLINVVCVFATARAMCDVLADVPVLLRGFAVFVGFFSLNVYGLVFTGMEHSLQLWCVAVIARWLIRTRDGTAPDGLRIDPLSAFCLALLPLVRYEGLAISIPAAVYLYAGGRAQGRRSAVVVLGISVGCIAAFSLFLHARGLGWMPSSILAKSAYQSGNFLAANLKLNLHEYGWLTLPVAGLFIAFWRRDPARSWMLAAVTVLHFVFGRFGWYGRYEVYFLLFVLVIAMRALADLGPKYVKALVVLPLCFSTLGPAIAMSTGAAASNIYFQQWQMAGIVQKLGRPVAVNDIGVVSLHSQHDVLDLWGLGSLQALRARTSGADPDWIGKLMLAKDVHFAMIFDNYFPNRPASWINVGTLSLTGRKVSTDNTVVSFYATEPAAAQELSEVLKRYADEHPSDGFKIAVRVRD